MNKKALSPIISVILIILVAVILITMFLTWSKEYYNNQLTNTTEQLKQASGIECANSKLRVSSCSFDSFTKELSLFLINDSQIRYFDFTLTIEGVDYTSQEPVRLYGIFKNILQPGEFINLVTDSNFLVLDSSGNYENIDLNNISLINLSNGACKNQNFVLVCSVD